MASKRKIINERESFPKRSKPMSPLCFYSYAREYCSPSDDEYASSVGSNEVFEEIINILEDEAESSPPTSDKFFNDTRFCSSPIQENKGILTNSLCAKEEEEQKDSFMDEFLANFDKEEGNLWEDAQSNIIDNNRNSLGEFRKWGAEDDESSFGLTQMFDEIFTHDEDEHEAKSNAPDCHKSIQTTEIPISRAILEEGIEKGILTNSLSAPRDSFIDDLLANVDDDEENLWVGAQSKIIDKNLNSLGEFRNRDADDDQCSYGRTQLFNEIIFTNGEDEHEAESLAPNCNKSFQSTEIPRSEVVIEEKEIEKDGLMMDDLLVELSEEETMFWKNYLSVINGNDADDDDDASSVGSNEFIEEIIIISDDEAESSPPISDKFISSSPRSRKLFLFNRRFINGCCG